MNNVQIVTHPPVTDAVIVDLAGKDDAPARGVLLTFVEPLRLLAVARAARRHDTAWVLFNLDTLPCRERRAAAFACALGKILRAPLFVVLKEDTLRGRRIAAHIRRATQRP